METSSLLDAEFKTLVIRMLKELSEWGPQQHKKDPVRNDTLVEIKNNLQGNNSRMGEAENQINDLEYKEPKNDDTEQWEKKIQKNEDSINSLWDNFKRSNICFIGVPEGEKEEQGIRNRFEKIMKEKVPNLVKE